MLLGASSGMYVLQHLEQGIAPQTSPLSASLFTTALKQAATKLYMIPHSGQTM